MVPVDSQHVRVLAALVQRVIEESGCPAGFDAYEWTEKWIQEAVPALGGARRAEYMTTPEGRAIVETLILQDQSGAYS